MHIQYKNNTVVQDTETTIWSLCLSQVRLYLPLALDGAEFIIWEELERIELRLEEEGLGCKTGYV